jgi:hypothetical protein
VSDDPRTSTRYPYTYSCDYIRSFGPVRAGEGVVLGRADASSIRQAIADAIGMDDEALAVKLAEKQLELEADPEVLQKQADRLLAALGYNQ